MKRGLLLTALTIIFLATLASAVVINEFTVDPQTDWDNSGSPTDNDEFIELYNPLNEPADLTNWTLVMNDSLSVNASIEFLSGSISPEDYITILNPAGSMNLNGQILLYDSSQTLIDSVSYGTWNDGNPIDNTQGGSSTSIQDECLSRIPNGADTNSDITDFVKTVCTYNLENGVLPDNQQGLNATIMGKIVLEILPRWLQFGTVQPGSINNPALNGPIIFNATGSEADVRVEITEVIGSPFDLGLKIDNVAALGKIWTILQTSSQVQNATPTLDIPENTPPGTAQGTIVYTVAGQVPA